MAKLRPWEARVANWLYPILGHETAILATFFEIWTSKFGSNFFGGLNQ